MTASRPVGTPIGSPSRSRRRWSLAALSAAALMSTASVAQADDGAYPKRPVRLVVSYAAGNVTDILARLVADGLATKWGQPVTVDNKPGQGGSLGAMSMVRSEPDGYTLLFSAMAAMAINPHVYAKVGYDPKHDFVPIINVAYPDAVLVASPSLGVKSWAQLLDYSKQRPDTLNYGTAGNGTVPHLNMEAIKQRSGLVAQHVPYKAAAAVLTDLMGGRVQLQFETSAVLLPQIKAGKIMPLAMALKRNPDLPDVPALGELLPGYVPVVPWLGLFAPAGTPEAIVNKVNRDVRDILAQASVKERLAGYGMSISGGTPQEFGQRLREDYERLGALTRQLGLKVD